jgi:hypothetical protein
MWTSLLFCAQEEKLSGPGNESSCLTVSETKRLAGQEKIDGRIKIYKDVSERFHRAVMDAVSRKSFDGIPSILSCWKSHLSVSLKDIEANINRKKKSGALIDYEIHLRKSIIDMSDARLRTTVEKQTDFESWIAQADAARQRFVDILFQR